MADIWKSNISVNGYADIFEVDNLGKNDYEKLAEVEEDIDEFVDVNDEDKNVTCGTHGPWTTMI